MEKYRPTCHREIYGIRFPMEEGEMFFGKAWNQTFSVVDARSLLDALADNYPLYAPRRQGSALRLTIAEDDFLILECAPAPQGVPVDLWPSPWEAPQVLTAGTL